MKEMCSTLGTQVNATKEGRMAKQVTKQAGVAGDVATAPYHVGRPYFIRTVTMYYIGNLIAVYPQELVLTQAVWVADTGRFYEAVTQGALSEVEPFGTGEVIIGRGSIIDASVWAHDLPTKQK